MSAPPTLHPSDQTLHAYGLGKLDDPTAESVNKHLESCGTCRRRVAELTSDSFLGRLREAQPRPDPQAPLISSTAGLSMLDAGAGPAQPPPASTLPPGLADRTDYEILRELGRGGMGVVYLAHNKLMGRPEVLKVVSSHLVNRSGVLDRFLVEIRNAAKLHHTNVVTAYSALRLGESLVLAMQYVEGLDLARLVAARGPLPVVQASNYVHQAAKGLQHAHEHGMVHRDIKPSNLMLAREGNRAVIKVLDFGLAKVRSEDSTDGTLTCEGQMLGTPHFIAPEQISNARRADIRADIYSLGCTLYYLLTGGPPFQGDSLYDILQAHHSMDAKPLNLARPEVPVELAALVAKMMAKEPRRRFQEPKDVAHALTPFFKKGDVAFMSPGVEISQDGQTGSSRPMPRVASAPTLLETNDAGSTARSKKAAEPSAPETEWKSLIDLGETEPSRDEKPAIGHTRRPPWLWPSVAVGVLLLGLLVAWGVVIRIKTANGTVELVNLPKDAEVFVNDKEASVTWPGGGKPAVITVEAGQHKVKVKKDGIEVYGEEVAIQAGGSERLAVRLIRPSESRRTNGATGDHTVSSDLPRTRETTVDPGVPTASDPPHIVTGNADSKSRPPEFLTTRIGQIKLKLIPDGRFLMGSPDSDKDANDDEKPAHWVRITRAFYLGTTEVTQAQFQAVTGRNPSARKESIDLPVENVSWNGAIAFCNELSAKEGLKPYYQVKGELVTVPDWKAAGYRLPTEAEWEYACRAGTPFRFSFGDDDLRLPVRQLTLGKHGWFHGNYLEGWWSHPVGEKQANSFGLYDMHGNVWEWCWDGYDGHYYADSPPEDPQGPGLFTERVTRGGCWNDGPRAVRAAYRSGRPRNDRAGTQGFRVAYVPPSGVTPREQALADRPSSRPNPVVAHPVSPGYCSGQSQAVHHSQGGGSVASGRGRPVGNARYNSIPDHLVWR